MHRSETALQAILATLAILTASLVLAASPRAAAGIDELRRQGQYEEALSEARIRAESVQRDPQSRTWQREDAARLVATLEIAVGLPDSARRELMEADRADTAIRQHIIDGEYRKATELAALQLRVRRQHLGSLNQETLRSLKSLADLANEKLEWERSPEMQAEVLAERRQVLGTRHPEVAESLQDLGYALKCRYGPADLDQAGAIFREALELRQEILDSDDPAIASALFWIADLRRVRQDYNGAIEGFKDVLDRRRRALGPGHADVAATESMLAYLLQLQNRLDEAAPHAARATAACRANPGVKLVDRAFALSVQGYVFARQHQLAEAEKLFTEVTRIQEFLRVSDATSPVRGNHNLLYGARAQLQLAQGKTQDAWLSLERGASRRVLDALVPPDPAMQGMATPSGDVRDTRFLPLAGIQAALPEGAAIIGWLEPQLYLPLGDLSSWGYVIRQSGPVHWVRLDIPAGTGAPCRENGRVMEYLAELRKTAAWPVRVPRTMQSERKSRDAYEERFAPLESSLVGIRRLIVVNSSITMAGVPIEGLIDASGRTLSDSYEIFYVPSANSLAWMRRKHQVAPNARRWKTLLVGDPAPATGQIGLDGGHFPPLPGSREEITSVASVFHSPSILLRDAASAENIRLLATSGEMSRYDLLHFAVHALDNRAAYLGALVLPPGTHREESPREDVLIEADEIAGWELNATLVTLSACQTLGGSSGPDSPLGLSTIFMMAGARSVLASLWKVEDVATSLLMRRFYENLTGKHGEPMSRPAALREARNWLRSYADADGTHPFEHPAYWAAFVLVGDALD